MKKTAPPLLGRTLDPLGSWQVPKDQSGLGLRGPCGGPPPPFYSVPIPSPRALSLWAVQYPPWFGRPTTSLKKPLRRHPQSASGPLFGSSFSPPRQACGDSRLRNGNTPLITREFPHAPNPSNVPPFLPQKRRTPIRRGHLDLAPRLIEPPQISDGEEVVPPSSHAFPLNI